MKITTERNKVKGQITKMHLLTTGYASLYASGIQAGVYSNGSAYAAAHVSMTDGHSDGWCFGAKSCREAAKFFKKLAVILDNRARQARKVAR
jgi:hypothetical protein